MKKILRKVKPKISYLLVFMILAQLVLPQVATFVHASQAENPIVNNEELPQEPLDHPEDKPTEEEVEGLIEEEDIELEESEILEKEERAQEKVSTEEETKEPETKEPETKEPIEGKNNELEAKEELEDAAAMIAPAGKMSTSNDGKDLGNIFTFESLKLDDVDIADGDIIEIKEDTKAELSFAWDTKRRNAQAGDTASIRLSDAFEIVTTPVEDLIVEGTNVGTYQVENGVLMFNFNEGIENDDVHNGWVNLELDFNLEKFRENIEQEIPFHDGSDQNITVVAKPNLDHSGIEKEGHPDTQHDAREITWTIDVINTNDEEITGATLADNIPDGLGEAREFVIHELSVGYDGDIREGDDVTSTLNPSVFPIDLGTIAPFNGYRVQYTTTIENYAAESFTNDATFEYGETSLPADTTVDGLTRSNPIEKSGWQVGNTDRIQWQIDVNKNGSLISEAIVEDELSDGLTIDPASIKVVRIKQSGGNWEEGDPHEISFTKFPIELGALGQEDAYRIKFETNVNWEEVNEGHYQENNGFQNETTLKDGEDELNDDDATVDIVREPILEKTGASNVDYDNKTLTWTIHVNEAGHNIGDVVLTDLIPKGLAITEGDIVITDITDEEGGAYAPISIDLNHDAEGGTEVKINLGDVGTRQLKVEYTTKITDFTINNFNNGVGMTGDGIGLDGENSNATIRPEGNVYGKSFKGIDYNAKTIDWELTVNPRREAISSLTIEDTFPNKGLILLPDTVDVKFAGGELEEGTHYTLAPRLEDEEKGYHKGFTITILDNALPLNDGQLIIDYQTSYDPQRVVNGNKLDPHEPNVGDDSGNADRLYVNRVQYKGNTVNNNGIDQTRTASHKVREDSWNSGKKEGQLVHFDGEGNAVNGWVSGSKRKIAWQLYFNYQEQNLGTGVVVTDELDYAGDIDAESIQVSVYDVYAGGETTITETVLDSSYYSVNTDEYGKFILTFADDFEVTERYVIEFTTSVPDISEGSYTNEATVTAGGKKYDYSATLNYNEHDNFLDKSAVDLDGNRVFTGDEVDWEATVNESLSIIKNAVITDTISAGHVYLQDSLEVYKSQDRENPLELGTDYTFKDIPVTDDNGELTGETNLIITMNEDLQDTLVLEYKTVVTETDGQIGNSISLDGTAIDRKFVNSDKLSARQFSSAGGEWAPNRGAIQLTKVDAEKEIAIENNEATFELWYELNGERVQYTQVDGQGEIAPFTTVNGVLEIGNLPIRTYYLTEVESPEGYVLSEEEIGITVKPFGRNENYTKIEFKNTKEKVDKTATKIWEDGPEEKPTVWFELYRQVEGGQVEAVPGAEIKELVDGTRQVEWTELERTDIDGNEYTYSVQEVDADGNDFTPKNYTKTEDGLEVTNTYVIPEDASATATKIWEDGPEEKPTVWFELYRQIEGGQVEAVPGAEIKELQDGTTQVEWTVLERTDSKGNEYTFSVREVDADGNDFTPENYVKTENGLEVTNYYVSPTDASAKAIKVWENGPQERPTIWFELYRQIEGGQAEVVPEAEIKELVDGTREVEWTELERTDSKGNEYTFTVREVGNPENYDASYSEDGLEVTNTYVIPTDASATATKIWEDGPEEKPTVWFELYRQVEGGQVEAVPGAEIKELVDGTRQVEWTELERTDIDGNEYVFSVREVDAEGNDFTPKNYTKTEEGLEVTNTYVIPTDASATATKKWEDGPEEKPTVWFELYRQVEGGQAQPVPDAEIKELVDGTSQVEWTELERTDSKGNEYTFSVREVDADGNDFTPENYVKTENGLEVTNYYVSPTDASAKAIKVWENGPQERPTIWFELYRQIEGGQAEVVPEAEIIELVDDIREVVWTNLTKTDTHGNEYIFSIKEVDAEGNDFVPENYRKTEDGLTVTNTYEIPKTEITANKTWKNAPGEKPSIELQLYRDGEAYGEPVTLEDGITEYTWTDLDRTDINGLEYNYTVDEVEVPEHYEKTISEDGLTVTNRYNPPSEPETPEPSAPDPIDPEKPESPGETETTSILPKTGMGSSTSLLVTGMGLLMVTVYLGFKRRRDN